MRISYFAWFDSNAERTEFISILNNSRSEIDAINKIMTRFPNLKVAEASGIVDNFKKEINKKL